MDPAAYLARIGHHGPLGPTLDTLRALQRRHLRSVPFENLDIHLGRPIDLRLAACFDKIVRRRRGGFCYELNGLFAWLLECVGFTVVRLSARVTTDGRVGPEFDHLALLVRLEADWLVDVGFGRSSLEPLPLVRDRLQEQAGTAYRLAICDEGWVMRERAPAGAWSERYRFTLRSRDLREFAAMCRHHQTAPASSFTRQRVCSRATREGRLTLTERELIETSAGRRRGIPVFSDVEYRELLRSQFGIEIGAAPWRRPCAQEAARRPAG